MFCNGACGDALQSSLENGEVIIELDDYRTKRNALVLAIASGLNGLGAVVLMTLGGIIGQMLSGRDDLATVPIATYSIGSLLMLYPASMIMQHFGRRVGFLAGAELGFMGALIGVYAIYQQSFMLFCVSAAFTGFYQAFANFYRFAAADTGRPGIRAKAVSWVMLGGLASAILGAQFVIQTKDLLAPAFYAGAFLAASVLAIASMLVLYFVDVPHSPVHRYDNPDGEAPRPLREILRQKRIRIAILTGTISHGVMMFGMTAAPIAMMACNHSLGAVAGVIQIHLLAMYLPGFFTGHLINRFGVERIMLTGLVLLVVAGSIASFGVELSRFALAMGLLGLGWNLSFVGATTLLTQCYRPSERGMVQGFNELVVFGFVALAALMAGPILKYSGWSGINITLIPFVLASIALVIWLFVRDKSRAQLPSI
ncbi:MAG: MFS transporter [Hyphomicrobiaceae bacterium]|nr:MFS transporter [Hyphomicrobiaceae bacterium]